MQYKNYLFLQKNENGTFTFMGKKFNKKPYFFLGKKSFIGLFFNLLALFLIGNENLGEFNHSTLNYIAIIILILLATYFYITDIRNYRSLD